VGDKADKLSTPRWSRIAKAIGLRLVVWGGVAALLLMFFGNVRSLILHNLFSSARPGNSQLSSRRSSDKSASNRIITDKTATPHSDPNSAGSGWPNLRGPTYDGCSAEKHLADTWPEQGPPLLWLRELGSGYSGFTAVGDRIYTQAQNLYAQSVLCLEADTGRTVWEQSIDWPYDAGGMYPGPRATPTCSEGCVYYASPQGRVGCLGADDGQPLWSVNVLEKFAGRGHDFGYSCSPLVEDGLVILPVGGKGASVVALDAENGDTVWAAGDEPASYSSAMPITINGRRCVAAFLQNALAVFDLHTGRLLWQKHWSQGYDEHSVQPLYQEPYLMIACPFRSGAEMYRLEAADETASLTVTQVWSSRDFSNDILSSVLVDGYVYGFDIRDIQAKAHRPSKGLFKCLELSTGKIRWASDRPGHAGVISADGKLILFNDSGQIVLARQSPESYEELGRSKIFNNEICWTAPSLSDGRLFLRSPTHAACVFVGMPDAYSTRPLPALNPASSAYSTKSIDWNWWIGGERECPFDLPDFKELESWFFISMLGVFLPSGLAAFAAYGLLHFFRRNSNYRIGQVVFWSACFMLGIAATPLANRLCPTFVFTWPVSLLVAQQLALASIFNRHNRPGDNRATLLSLIAGLGFVAVCLSYFHVCRQLGMALQWIFLLGFVPSWPLAIPSAYFLARRPKLIRDILLAAAVFTLFYWSCGGYILWRSVR
jgi:PQQ-like domain